MGWSVLKRIFAFLLPYWYWELLLFVLLAAATILGLVYPAVIGQVFDVLAGGADSREVLRLALIMLAATVGGTVLSSAVALIQTWVTARVLLDMRDRAFASLQATGLERLSRQRLGDLMSRLGSDLNEVQQIATGTLMSIVGGLMTLLFASYMLARIDGRLFTLALIFLPPSLLLAALVRKPIHSRATRVKERMADSASVAVDALRSQRLVRSLGARDTEAARFHEANRNLVGEVLGLQWLQAGSGVGAQIILAGTAFVVLLVGASRVREDAVTSGELIAFALYQVRLYAPAQGLVGLYLNLQRARASVDRVFQLMDPPPEQGFGRGAREADPPLAVEAISLTVLRGGRPVLRGVELRAEPGRATALVGRSGGGKSSLLDAMAGLAVRGEGELRIGGIPVDEWAPGALRRRVALVDQEPLLRRGSLRDNLCYGLEAPGPKGSDGSADRDRMPPDETLRAALDALGLQHLDLGRELEEHGEGLSSGEARRVALARALLRDPAVLLLDEVGANLDKESADRIREVAAEEIRRRTVVLATHRRAELMLAADALWIEDGVVRDRGEPDRFVGLTDDAAGVLEATEGSAGSPPAERTVDAE